MGNEVTRRRNHPERFCHRCGVGNVGWCAPSPLWNEVMRGGDITARDWYDGIVCPTCFARIAEGKGIAYHWKLTASKILVPLTLVTPSGRVWDDEAWLWRPPA